MRVVSLVPSLTELVYHLGRGAWLVGRTRFCDQPPEVAAVPAVGGTKDPDVATVIALRPDLVIANREENRREDVEALTAAGLRVLVTDPNSVADACAMVRELGGLLDAPEQAGSLADQTLAECRPRPDGPRVFVAVWNRPLLGLGDHSYGHEVLLQAGATNVLAGRPRYPEVSRDELAGLKPDLILLPDEPFRFRERHRAAFEEFAPTRLVDGRLLWWYGPRMPQALRGLCALFDEIRR
jgi:ABC-type hemin transport system substrate-binding protein